MLFTYLGYLNAFCRINTNSSLFINKHHCINNESSEKRCQYQSNQIPGSKCEAYLVSGNVYIDDADVSVFNLWETD